LCNSAVSLKANNAAFPFYIINISDKHMQLRPHGLPENVFMTDILSLPPGAVFTAWIEMKQADVLIADKKSIHEVDLVADDGEVKAQFRLKIQLP
ncbi:MAG: hypothetical protein ACKOW8_03725, partial [Flavobacteriales bacterium]